MLGLPSPKGTILIVDDDPGSRYSLGKLLTSAGYKVLEARDRIEAIEQFQFSMVDLVILNVGESFLEALGTVSVFRQRKAGLKVIAISELPEALEGVGEQIQANALLKRPIQPNELLEMVGRLASTAKADGGS